MQSLRKTSSRIRQKKQMNVAMVSVPSVVLLDERKDAYSPRRTNYFPHAQVLLGTIVKKHAESRRLPVDVRIVDLKSTWKDQLTEYGEIDYGGKRLTKHFVGDGFERTGELAGYDVIGITANYTLEANSVVKTIAEIRRINPDAVIVLGGKDASARPAYYRRMDADVVAIGDADRSFPSFIESLINGSVEETGILVDDLRGKIRSVPLLDFSLLPRLHHHYQESPSGRYHYDMQLPQFEIAAYFETSRGCSGSCEFCTEAKTQRSDFDLDALKEMAEHYRNKGAKLLLFSDDNILQRIRRKNGERELIEFFRFLRSLNLVWEFSVGVELGMLADGKGRLREELIEAMFQNEDVRQKSYFRSPSCLGDSEVSESLRFVGASRVLAPLEDLGSRHNIKKMLGWKQEKGILRKLISIGVPQINLGIMLGFPHDNAENISRIRAKIQELEEMRLEINERNRPTKGLLTAFNHSLFCVMPLPGTPLYEQMKTDGRIKYDIEKDPELWNVFTSVIEGDSFAPERITQLRREFIKEFGSVQPDGRIDVAPVKGAVSRRRFVVVTTFSDNWNVM
jgi:biotin synthase-like enzyme